MAYISKEECCKEPFLVRVAGVVKSLFSFMSDKKAFRKRLQTIDEERLGSIGIKTCAKSNFIS